MSFQDDNIRRIAQQTQKAVDNHVALLRKKLDEFFEETLKALFPEGVVKILGDTFSDKAARAHNSALLNQLGIHLVQGSPTDPVSSWTVQRKPRRKGEAVVVLSKFEVIYEIDNKVTLKKSVSRRIVDFRYDLWHPAIRVWLRYHSGRGNKLAKELLDKPSVHILFTGDGETVGQSPSNGEFERPPVNGGRGQSERTIPLPQKDVGPCDGNPPQEPAAGDQLPSRSDE